MSSNEPPHYNDDYLLGLFGMTSEEIRATGVSVEAYVAHNARKALKNPDARKVYLSKLSPADRALQNGRERALKTYPVIFVSFSLLLLSAIPAVNKHPVPTEILRLGAVVGCILAFAMAVPAVRSFFNYSKLKRRQNKNL